MKETKHTAGPLIWLHHHRHGVDVAVLGHDIEPTTHFDVSQDREDEYLEEYTLPEPYASAPSLLAENERLRKALLCVVAALDQPVQHSGTIGEGAAISLRGDATFARNAARAALAALQGGGL